MKNNEGPDVGTPLPPNTVPDDPEMAAYFVREHISMLAAQVKEMPPRPPKRYLVPHTKRDLAKVKRALQMICHHARHALSLLETVEEETNSCNTGRGAAD